MAGYKMETSYFQLLNEANIPYSLTGAKGKIQCHQALIHIYQGTTDALMLRALKVAKLAADGREEFYKIGFFPGLCSLIVKHPKLNDHDLIVKVKAKTSAQIREIAKAYSELGTGSSGATASFRKAFINIYNKGLKQAGRLTEDN